LKKAKEGDTIEEIKQAGEQLSQALQKIGAAMYQNPPASPGQGGPSAEGGQEGEKPSSNQ